MKKNTSIWLVVIAVMVLFLVILYLISHRPKPIVQAPVIVPSETVVSYFCDQGHLKATYSEGQVKLLLADDRLVTLPQVESGSGTRYEAETMSFSSKGNYAFLIDSGSTIFDNCVAGTVSGSGDKQTFTDAGKTFSFMFPALATVSGSDGAYTTDWMFNTTSTGMLLARVTLPDAIQPQTNFRDARFTVGSSSQAEAVTNCLSSQQGAEVATSTVDINGEDYTMMALNDAGAGNFYQTTSYHLIHDNQCYVIEYTIHTTNIDNYSPDQGITEYDADSVKLLLESIIQSFRWL